MDRRRTPAMTGWSFLVGVATAAGLAACTATAGHGASSHRSAPSIATGTTTTGPTATTPSTATTPATATSTTTGGVSSINYGAAMTVSATDVAVGEEVTISGTDCRPGHWGTAFLDPGLNTPAIFERAGYTDLEDFTTADGDSAGGTADAAGQWSMTVAVPMVAPGTSMLTGWCAPSPEDQNPLTSDFRYPSVPITVSSPYRLEVAPATTVRAGTVLTVTLLGGDCPNPGAAEELSLFSPTGTPVATPEPSAGATTEGQYALEVPPGSDPGQYQLEDDCVENRGAVFGSYAPVTITVE